MPIIIGENMNEQDKQYYISLINELSKKSYETEWAEFKVNNDSPDAIGECISSISNAISSLERDGGYLIYGIDGVTHEIVGTNFNPREAKVGDEELENWLLSQLVPRIELKFADVEIEGKHVVVIEIPAANHQPTAFKGVEYICEGSQIKKLNEYPEQERELWRSFGIRTYETLSAKDNVDAGTVMELLDAAGFYCLTKLPVPKTVGGIMQDFKEYGFVQQMDNGNYIITNLGVLLFAKDFTKFDHLNNKAIRIIQYKGNGRTHAFLDRFFQMGYAIAFERILTYIQSILYQEEMIKSAFGDKLSMFPEKAIREMLGNLMIHQDLTARGQSLMIEIFGERIEATFPGKLLVDVDRIMDTAPRARNEKLASFLRSVHICAGNESAFDLMEEGVASRQITAPKVEIAEDYCRTMLFWRPKLSDWSKDERIRTCYLYACYCYVNGVDMTGAALRKRLGIREANTSMTSWIIRETINAGKIKLVPPDATMRLRRYIPYWA